MYGLPASALSPGSSFTPSLMPESANKPAKPNQQQQTQSKRSHPRKAPIDRYRLLIECRDEAHQEQLYQKLTRQGLQCRPLVL